MVRVPFNPAIVVGGEDGVVILIDRMSRKKPVSAERAVPDERSAWLCNTVRMLDDFTERNGALRVVPGSHRWNGLPRNVREDTIADHSPSCGDLLALDDPLNDVLSRPVEEARKFVADLPLDTQNPSDIIDRLIRWAFLESGSPKRWLVFIFLLGLGQDYLKDGSDALLHLMLTTIKSLFWQADSDCSPKKARKATEEMGIRPDEIRQYRFIRRPNARLRTSRRRRSAIIHRLQAGEAVIILRKVGRWSEIECNGPDGDDALQGWTLSKYLARPWRPSSHPLFTHGSDHVD